MNSLKLKLLPIFFLMPLLVYAQDGYYDSKSNNTLNRFGYKFSLFNLNKYDSNVLKLSSSTSDLSSSIYPAISFSYPFSTDTKVTVQYLFGIEKFVSTSFLNTNFNRVGANLSHYFSPNLEGQISGFYIHSNQPDILTTSSSVYRFATFGQYSGSFKLNWLKSSKTLYSLEYSFIQRNYSHLLTLSLNKQQDNYNYVALSWTYQINQATTASMKLGFIESKSNNLNYKFDRQFLDAFLMHNLGSGFKVQAEDIISSLGFSNRTLSNNPFTTRSDVINNFMIGVKKDFGNNIAFIISYYLQKDFSNEPIRKFLSNTITLGLEFSIRKNSNYVDQNYSNESNTEKGFGLNKEIATAEQLTNTGYQYILKGNYDKALEYSLKALSLDNNIEKANINAGVAYYKKGMKKEAIKYWKKALKLNPNNEKLELIVNKAEAEIIQKKN